MPVGRKIYEALQYLGNQKCTHSSFQTKMTVYNEGFEVTYILQNLFKWKFVEQNFLSPTLINCLKEAV